MTSDDLASGSASERAAVETPVTTPMTTQVGPVSASPSPKIHLAYLDGLRALAALYVVLHHAGRYVLDALTPDQMTPVLRLLAFILMGGGYAVVLFIVLSGFCLMLPVVRGDGTLRGGALHFFGRRARRILPPYYFATGLSLLLIFVLIGTKTATPWDDSLPVTPFSLVTHLFLIHDAFRSTNHGINYPLWTVAVEWQIYFFFPALVWLWRRLGPVKTVAATVALGLLGNEAVKNTQFVSTSPLLLGMFALGMLGAGIAYGGHERLAAWRQRVPWPWLTLGLAVAFYAPEVFLHGHPFGSSLSSASFGMLSTSLLVWAARPGTNAVRRVLSWKPFVAVGLFSYSLYLIHAPLLQLSWQYGLAARHMTPLPLFFILTFIGVPMIVAASYVFSLACERPFLNSKPKAATKQI